MEDKQKKVWFPAKTYGWGWGLPCSWQGWVVMALWVALLTAGLVIIGPSHTGTTLAFSALMAGVLIAICWIKGEKPHWRWGKD